MTYSETDLENILDILRDQTPPDNYCLHMFDFVDGCVLAAALISKLQTEDLSPLAPPENCSDCEIFQTVSQTYKKGKNMVKSIQKFTKSN